MLLFLLLATAYAYSTVENCNERSLFPIYNLTLVNKTLYTTYEAHEEIRGGTAVCSCYLNGFHVFHSEHDLCTYTVCPITANVHTNSTILEIPHISGALSCTIQLIDTLEQPLLCIEMKFTEPLGLFSKWF